MKYTLVVDKKILLLLSALMWFGVGIMLIHYAFLWLSPLPAKQQLLYYAAGFLLAMPVHHFGFLKIADKNLARLMQLTENKSVFSFMTWKSYMIVLIMITMGIMLRHSSIPKKYLSVIYNGIGLALFLSAIRYFRNFLMLLFRKKATF